MPYQNHPACQYPDEENCKIWRYVDFPKFVSLLQEKSLFFTIGEKLAQMDPFEGTYTKLNISERARTWKYPEARINFEKALGWGGDLLFLNCWSMSEIESDAMWKIYLKDKEGLAIQSTVKKLKESFNANNETIHIGKVNYIDYEKEMITDGNVFYPFLHKRKHYEHEHEVRVVNMDATQRFQDGKHISVDLDTLVESVYISPNTATWFTKIVESIMNKYELHKEVKLSKLSERPYYPNINPENEQ